MSLILLFKKWDFDNHNIIFWCAGYNIPGIRKPFSEYVKVAYGTIQKTRFRKSENNFPICRIWYSENQKPFSECVKVAFDTIQKTRFLKSENNFPICRIWHSKNQKTTFWICKSHSVVFRKRDSENQKIILHYTEYDIPRIRKPFSEYVKAAFGTVRKTKFRKPEHDFPLCRIWLSENQKPLSEYVSHIRYYSENEIPKIRK